MNQNKEIICRECSFVLTFAELPSELVEQKIDTIIITDYQAGILECPSIKEALVNEDLRLEVRDFIEAHFPLCF